MSLKQKTISGVGWNSAGNVARQVLQIIIMVVMARFLSPDDFGVYAILMIFVSFVQILGSMGTVQVIVHMDKPNQRMLSSIFFFNIAIGVFLFAILYFLAWPLAAFFDNPDLTHLLQIIGATFIISAFSLVQNALLEKNMLFKKVVTFETAALAIGSFAGIVAAVAGMGVYSLIILSLSNATLLTMELWFNSHWRPSFQFSFDDIKRVWNYTINLTSFTIINYFARNADNFLIGKFIGSSALGIYSVAYKIMLYPVQNVSRVIVRVLFPSFSQVKHDNQRFKNGYLKAITFIALVTFPIMAGLLAVSEIFVAVVFDDKWIGMASLIMILAPIGMMQSIVTTVGSIYTAKGTTGLMFKIGAVNAVVTVVSFVIGLPYGVEGVAIAYAIANAIMLYPNLKISWYQIDLGVLEALLKLGPFFIASMVMASIVYFQGQWLDSIGINLLAVLPMQVATGAVIYTGILLLLYRPMVISLLAEFKKKKVTF